MKANKGVVFSLLVAIVVFATEVSAATNEVVRCQSATLSGSRCKRRAVAGDAYCRQHAAKVKVKVPFKTCQTITTNETCCTSKPVKNRRYCKKHLGH